VTRPPDDPFERLRDAEARFRLRRHRAEEAVVDAAVSLLAAGVDTPEVAIVAGDDRVEHGELGLDLDRALVALELEPLTVQMAGLRLAIAIAREIVAGEGDLRAAAQELWELWLASDEPEQLNDLAITADGFVDAPEYISLDALREAASGFLDQAPTG
jgi:hypothetical protein